ncbi:MAG: extracellular solute-binding protein [Sarcina sp.]
MKKKFLAVTMAVMMAGSTLIACGGSSNTETGSKGSEIVTEIQDPVTIEFWHYMNGKQGEAMDALVKEFNETNDKKITVKSVSQGGIPDLNKKVITAAQSNTLPAIINVYPDIVTGLLEKDKIVNLSDYINDEKVGMKEDIEKDFVKSFVDEVAQWEGGDILGMPLSKSTEVIFVNVDKLKELGYEVEEIKAGMSINKLIEISKASKEKLGMAGFGFDSSSNAFITALKADNKDFVSLDGKINVDNEWTKEFMQTLKDQTAAGNFRIAGEEKYLSGPFSNGKLLMYQGSTAGASHIKNNDAFEVAVIEVPVYEGKSKSVIQQGASLFVTKDVSKEAQYAAYEFLKFATSAEVSAKFASATGYLPVRKSATDTEAMKKVLEDKNSLYTRTYEVAQKALEYSYYSPAVNNANSARNVIAEKYDAFVTGNIADVDTFIKETVAQVQTSIGRN